MHLRSHFAILIALRKNAYVTKCHLNSSATFVQKKTKKSIKSIMIVVNGKQR